jgi:diacylglycerol kinase family enzyme
MLLAANIPWSSSTMCLAPYAQVNDGTIDLFWVGDVGRCGMLNLLLGLEDPNTVKGVIEARTPGFEYHKVTAFKLTPRPYREWAGKLDLDGEMAPSEVPIHVEVLPSKCTLLCPFPNGKRPDAE